MVESHSVAPVTSMDDDSADFRPGLGYGVVLSGTASQSDGAMRFVRSGEVVAEDVSSERTRANDSCLEGTSGNIAAADDATDDRPGIGFQRSPNSVAGSLTPSKPMDVAMDVGLGGADDSSDPAVQPSTAHDTPMNVNVDVKALSNTAELPSGGSDAKASDAANSRSSAEGDLSPLEIERRKLLAFEEKLKKFDTDREMLSSQKQVLSPQKRVQSTIETDSNGLHADDVNMEEVNSRSVCVFGLDSSCNTEALQDLFKASGPINRVTIVVDKMTGMSKGFAYIEFKDVHGVQNALLMNGTMFREYPLKVTQKLTSVKGKGKDKAKGKEKGKMGKVFDTGKSKGLDYTKGKGKSKYFGNIVYRPNASGPY